MLKKIKQLCVEKDISLRELEHGAGIAANTISKWGNIVPSVEKVKKVADYFGVTVDELLRDDEAR